MFEHHKEELEILDRLFRNMPEGGFKTNDTKYTKSIASLDRVIGDIRQFQIQQGNRGNSTYEDIYFIPDEMLAGNYYSGTMVHISYHKLSNRIILNMELRQNLPYNCFDNFNQKLVTPNLNDFSNKIGYLYEKAKSFIIDNNGEFDDSQYNQINLLLIAAYRHGYEDAVEEVVESYSAITRKYSHE